MPCCHLSSVRCDECAAFYPQWRMPDISYPQSLLPIHRSPVPHKCPVCLGEGKRLDKEKIEMVKCKACINGIVWG